MKPTELREQIRIARKRRFSAFVLKRRGFVFAALPVSFEVEIDGETLVISTWGGK